MNKFIYTQKQVDEVAGYPVSLGDRVEGVDWVRKVQGRGHRVMWSEAVYAGFVSKARSSEAEPEQDVELVTQPERQQEALKQQDEPVDAVKEAKVAKKFANTRFVDTALGDRVFVGRYGQNMRVNQMIRYKDNTLVLQRGTCGKLLKIV